MTTTPLPKACLQTTTQEPQETAVQPTQIMRVTVLGATGSIGTSTLDIIARDPECFDVEALSAGTNVDGLANAAKKHAAKLAIIADETRYKDLKTALSGTGIEVAAGEQALIDAATRPADCIIAAIVGAAGLRSAYAAVAQGTRIGLANKECLVCAGDAFTRKANARGTQIIPVDSEHSGVFQALTDAHASSIEKITLTASGGPFRDWSRERIKTATPAQALQHPNWSMGPKITIDSATMMNKGLELIEAYHLFPVSPDQLDAVVHQQSIVHSLVSFTDGSVIAQLSEPDMRTPISLALGWPHRLRVPTKRLDLATTGTLTFAPLDEARFPAVRISREVLAAGGAAATVMNAANEVAVEAFLAGRIGFYDITETVDSTLNDAEKSGLTGEQPGIDQALAIDAHARTLAHAKIASLC